MFDRLPLATVLNMHSPWFKAADEDKWSWASLYISGIGLLSRIYLAARIHCLSSVVAI